MQALDYGVQESNILGIKHGFRGFYSKQPRDKPFTLSREARRCPAPSCRAWLRQTGMRTQGLERSESDQPSSHSFLPPPLPPPSPPPSPSAPPCTQLVDEVHLEGGSVLGTSETGECDVMAVVRALDLWALDFLFVLGAQHEISCAGVIQARPWGCAVRSCRSQPWGELSRLCLSSPGCCVLCPATPAHPCAPRPCRKCASSSACHATSSACLRASTTIFSWWVGGGA